MKTIPKRQRFMLELLEQGFTIRTHNGFVIVVTNRRLPEQLEVLKELCEKYRYKHDLKEYSNGTDNVSIKI